MSSCERFIFRKTLRIKDISDRRYMGLFGKKSNKKFNELDIALLKLQNECNRRNTQAEQASTRANEFHQKAIDSIKNRNTDLAKMYLCLEKEARKYSKLLSVTCVEVARQKRLLQERISQISLVDAMKTTNDLLNRMKIDGDKLEETMGEIQQHMDSDRARIAGMEQMISGNKEEIDSMMAELMQEITIEKDMKDIPSHEPIITDTCINPPTAIADATDEIQTKTAQVEEECEVEMCMK